MLLDQDGSAPLHLAAIHGRTEVARILLAAGAQVDARDKVRSPTAHAYRDALLECGMGLMRRMYICMCMYVCVCMYAFESTFFEMMS